MTEHTLTINIVRAGTPKANSDKKSPAGHMWFSICDGNGPPTPYGFGPIVNEDSSVWEHMVGPGKVDQNG